MFAVILIFLNPAAQSAGGSWDLGKYSFVQGQSSGPLLETLKHGTSLTSYSFVSGVGGIAFIGVAVPDTNIGLKKLNLRYDPTQPDGRRLKVNIEEKTLSLTIYDWQLIPIARFADSSHNACVSLFGPQTTQAMYDIIYHPAFQDTLMGVRLLQADILLFDITETWQLPKWNGKLMLGAGETMPSGLNQTSANELHSVFRSAKFQSWVMTDEKATVGIHWNGKQIVLSGEPYYYFWTSNIKTVQKNRADLISKLEKLRNLGKVYEYNQLVQRINAMEPEVLEVKTLTEGLKQKSDALRRLNPAVYDAATQTMRFSALFRFVKQRNPENWNEFSAQIRQVTISPCVKTPTQWEKTK